MKRLKQIIISAAQKARTRNSSGVPLVVPHGGADAGRDFESAFEVLPRDEPVRNPWRRARVRIPFARAT